MEDFSKHKPRSCLEVDDLEALNVLYPDCLGGASTPLCDKPALNLGWLRILLFMAVFVVALVLAAALRSLARYKLRRIASKERALLGRAAMPADAAEQNIDEGFGAVVPP